MNPLKTFFLVSAAAVLAGAALAQPGSGWTPCGHGAVDCDPTAPVESTLTRDEVRAELQRAQREGRIVNGNLAVLNGLLSEQAPPPRREADDVQRTDDGGPR